VPAVEAELGRRLHAGVPVGLVEQLQLLPLEVVHGEFQADGLVRPEELRGSLKAVGAVETVLREREPARRSSRRRHLLLADLLQLERRAELCGPQLPLDLLLHLEEGLHLHLGVCSRQHFVEFLRGNQALLVSLDGRAGGFAGLRWLDTERDLELELLLICERTFRNRVWGLLHPLFSALGKAGDGLIRHRLF
jgi:hypothetical protein